MHQSFIFRYKFHYLLTLAAFVVWMLFFDEKGFFTRQKGKAELEKLEQKIAFYKKGIAETQSQIHALDNDTAMLEKYAREKYFMKRDNEDVFVIEEPAR